MRLRGHHLLCILGFRGMGYSKSYTENLSRIVGQLRSSGDTTVEVVHRPDDVCSPCPFLKEGGCAQRDPDSEKRVGSKDLKIMERIGLGEGEVLSWGEILKRIQISFCAEDLTNLCQECPWLSYGCCQEGLADLKGEKQSP